jgi:serine/threonine protein kinase
LRVQQQCLVITVPDYLEGGDFFSLLGSVDGSFSEDDARFYLAETVLALEYLHQVRSLSPLQPLPTNCIQSWMKLFSKVLNLSSVGLLTSKDIIQYYKISQQPVGTYSVALQFL